MSMVASNVGLTPSDDVGNGPLSCHLDLPSSVDELVLNVLELINFIVSGDGYVPSPSTARLDGNASHGPNTN